MTDEVQQHQSQQLDVESGQSLLSAQKDREKDEISNFIKSFVDNYVLNENGSADLIRKLNEKPEWIKAFHKIHGTIFIQIFKKSAPTSLNSRKYRKVLKE